MKAPTAGSPGRPAPRDEAPLAETERVEIAVGLVLRSGVVTSLGLMVLGIVLVVARSPGALRDPSAMAQFVGAEAKRPSTLGAIIHGLEALHPESVVALGLLVLIATPIARVTVSVVAFWSMRDRLFAAITGLVLVILLVSFALGRAG
ncbi:MAG: DUF1634 domain-containing protein [Phycisphaerales bacterium]